MVSGKAGPARRVGHRDVGDEKEEMRPRQIAHGGLAGPRISGLACSHMNAPVIGFPFDVPTWGEHLNAKDPLALVIRGHLYVEAALVRLIESAIVDKKALDVARLPFRAKVKFAKALGKLDSADARVVDVLGRLRDKFAHDLNTQLSAQDELDVHNAMSPRQRKIADALRNQIDGLSFETAMRPDSDHCDASRSPPYRDAVTLRQLPPPYPQHRFLPTRLRAFKRDCGAS